MKKVLLILCVLLLTGCGSQKVTVDSIQKASSRYELAEALNCDPSELKQIITNINNLYEILPETSDNKKKDYSIKYTDDGEIMVHRNEILSYIEKIDITEDNWKDICGVIKEKHVRKNAFGEIESEYDEVYFGTKEGYVFSDDGAWALKLHDNLNDIDVILPDSIFEEVKEESVERFRNFYGENINVGDITYNTHDDLGTHYFIFDIDNMTCIQTKGYVYKVSIPEEYICMDEETGVRRVNYYCEYKGGILEGDIIIDGGYSIDRFINQD